MNINSRDDQVFLKRLTAIVEANLGNENFGVNELAAKAELSRSQLHRKLKFIQNKSISQFIREIRLEKSKELLEKGNLTVSEIAFSVGFGSPSYFIKCFHDYFGYSPGEYIKYFPEVLENETGNNAFSKKTKVIKTGKALKLVLFLVVFVSTITIIYLVIQNQKKSVIQYSAEKSIIVIPFENLSSDEDNRFFADGMSLSIRDQLAKIPGLKVIPYTTSEIFRERKLSSPEIARQANANYILGGSVQRQNESVRINVILIEAIKDKTLWQETYDREFKDIFAIEDAIAIAVADKLQSFLTPDEIKQIEKLHPKNIEAYENYMMGRYFCLSKTFSSLQKSVNYFERAIEIDSGFAIAYAGLANAYYAGSTIWPYFFNSSEFDKAYQLAEKAIDMNSNLSEAYAILGIVNCIGYWKYEEARILFEKAIELDSNCMEAHYYYSTLLDILGEPDDAIKQINKAIELEPYFSSLYLAKGNICHNAKRYTESVEAYLKILDFEPQDWISRNCNLFNYFALNEMDLAVQTLYEVFLYNPQYQKYEDQFFPEFEGSGLDGVLRLWLSVKLKEDEIPLPINLYCMFGMHKEALDCLEKSYELNIGNISSRIRNPEFENLRSESRFIALVDSLNLTPYFPTPHK